MLLPPAAPLLPEQADSLRLRPSPEPVAYEARIWWESYAGPDTYQTSTIIKDISLHGQPLADGRVALDFRTSPPVIPNAHHLDFLEMVALRLAALYQRVVVEAAPTGEFVAVRNYAELEQTWAALAQSLQACALADDRLTPSVIETVSKQLQDPANVLHSLRHDYLYAALVPDFYAQPLGGEAPPARTRAFSQFFDELPLYFAEHIAVQSSPAEADLTLVCHGTLDTQQTNVAAITALIAEDVNPLADGELAVVPHFHYEATHVLERATGLPRHVELKVYTRVTERYNKQYSLTISRLS